MTRKKGVAKTNSGPKRDKLGRLTGGNPGNKGGKGATRKTYKLWLEKLLHSPTHRAAFEAQMNDGTATNFAFATRHAAETAYGKAPQRIEIEDTTPPKALGLEEALTKIAQMAKTVKAIGPGATQAALDAIPEAEIEEIEE